LTYLINGQRKDLYDNKIHEVTKEVKEGLIIWKQCIKDCESDCLLDSCLFYQYQSRIHFRNIQGVYNLCTLLKSLSNYMDHGIKLKKNGPPKDLYNWTRLPGCFGCKQ